jgi:hypothetical protein
VVAVAALSVADVLIVRPVPLCCRRQRDKCRRPAGLHHGRTLDAGRLAFHRASPKANWACADPPGSKTKAAGTWQRCTAGESLDAVPASAQGAADGSRRIAAMARHRSERRQPLCRAERRRRARGLRWAVGAAGVRAMCRLAWSVAPVGGFTFEPHRAFHRGRPSAVRTCRFRPRATLPPRCPPPFNLHNSRTLAPRRQHRRVMLLGAVRCCAVLCVILPPTAHDAGGSTVVDSPATSPFAASHRSRHAWRSRLRFLPPVLAPHRALVCRCLFARQQGPRCCITTHSHNRLRRCLINLQTRPLDLPRIMVPRPQNRAPSSEPHLYSVA